MCLHGQCVPQSALNVSLNTKRVLTVTQYTSAQRTLLARKVAWGRQASEGNVARVERQAKGSGLSNIER